MWSGWGSRSDGSGNYNLSWIWIVVALVLIAALFSNGGGAWWLIFPLFGWVIPTIRHAIESPEERARRYEARIERQRQKYEYKLERYRARHPERSAAYNTMSKRKNDESDSLDELVEEKPKNAQNPRYVLIGDGEIMQVDSDEAAPSDEHDNTPYVEPPLRSRSDSDYI